MELFLKEINCRYYASPFYFKFINLYWFSVAYNIWVIAKKKKNLAKSAGDAELSESDWKVTICCFSNNISTIQEVITKATKGKLNKIIT